MEPSHTQASATRLARSWVFRTALAALVFFGLLTAVSIARFGSLARGLAYLKGVRLMMQPSTIDLGTGRAGEERRVSFRVVNLERQPVKLIGAKTSCGCVATRGLPVQIPAGESRVVEVDIRIISPGDPSFRQDVAFFTDLPEQPMVEASIFARVPDPGPAR